MSPHTFIFRADATTTMGTGHVIRSLALAQGLQGSGAAAVFAMAESTSAIDDYLASQGVEVVRLKSSSADADHVSEVANLSESRGARWIIVDGYHFSPAFQSGLKGRGLKLLFIDDCGQSGSYRSDIVVDQNFSASAEMYARRKPDTKLLLGLRYAMLRREFQPWRSWKREIPEVGRRLLITIGGSDPDQLTLRLIEAVGEVSSPSLSTTVVVGGSNPGFAELQRAANAAPVPIHVVRNISNMPEQMANSDAAIICGGGTLWELLFMGCPTLSYSRDPLQEKIIGDLSAAGLVRNLGRVDEFDSGRLARAVEELLLCHKCRAEMAELGRPLIDGQGVRRIIEQMVPREPELTSLTLVPIQTDEKNEFLKVAAQHFQELNPSFTPASDWQDHYFATILNDPAYSLRWIFVDGHRVGFVLFGVEKHRFLPRKTGAIYELYISPEQRRRGIARTCALKVIEELRKSSPSKIQLEVTEGNVGASRLWKSLGFREVTERFVLDGGLE